MIRHAYVPTMPATLQTLVYLFYASKETCLCVTLDGKNWVIDTGTSYDATPHLDFIVLYKSDDFGMIKYIVEIGDISMSTTLGCRLVLKDVRHIPNFHLNLF